jgi:hypothetical protein
MQKLRLGEEAVPIGEDQATTRIVEMLKKRLARNYPLPNKTLRDAHPKQHGLVRAEFRVEPSLPHELRVGLFADPREFQAWIRFSNMSEPPQADFHPDSRGMAIKVMGVEGEKILESERDAKTQDFVLMSTDFFVTKDVAGFADFVAAIEGGTLRLIGHFLTHPRLLWLFFRARSRCGSPLEIRYGSTTPYLFGARAVKYSVRPHVASPTPVPARPDPDYLRLAMMHTLALQEARFDFLVQFQTDAERMPIEDPRVVWDESSSPYVKLATIRIPPQEFDTTVQRELGENMHFTPWHSLPEHRPLGGVNRGRKIIYEEMSRFRQHRNGVPHEEPIER